MHIVPIAWMFVVLLMSVAEATSTQGTLLGAFFTLVLYGLMPLAIVMYVLGTPARRRARQRAERLPEAGTSAYGDADASSHAPGLGIAPERKEP